MLTRRSFLHRTGGVLVSLPALWALPFVPAVRDAVTYGLFFDAAALPGLRSRFETPLFASLREVVAAVDRDAERRFMAEEVRTNDHLYHIPRLHNLAPRMAFLYAMTGDEDAAALAVEAVRTMLRFPKWDYFLDGDDVIGIQRASGAVVATACTADWLGDYVEAGERATWLRTMGERGCEACFRSTYGMRYPDRVKGWRLDPESTYLEHRPYDRALDLSNWPHILDRTNLKAVPASALAIGAAAYEQAFGRSETTDRWIEQAVYSIRTFRDLYARDGSYDEGVSYAEYTSLHLAQATEVLGRLRGLDLYDTINWPGFMDYGCGLAMPTTDDPYAIVNFGDAGNGLLSDVPFWIAARSGDRRAQWFGRTMTRGHSEWSLIWYDPEQAETSPPTGPSLWHSDLDWITARTGYTADDLVVGMRSGGPSNHEHADRGSLVVKSFGEVLVADPYRPPYPNSDPSWLLRTTAGHSALLIDGQGHQYHDGSEGTNASDAEARLVRVGEREELFTWASDATPAYRLVLPHVASVTRTVVVLHDVPVVLVLDKVTTDGTPVQLQARFFGDNRDDACRIEADGARFRTTRPGARLEAVGYATAGATAVSARLPIPEERAAQHPYAEVATVAPGAAPLLVTALLPLRPSDAPPDVAFSPADDGLRLTVSSRGRHVRCRIADTGILPEVISF